jgi:uracil phosphoribosyltransferase
MCIIACEVGIERLHNEHPDVEIYCAAVDPLLLPNNYISPGLGDAGDRLYGKI